MRLIPEDVTNFLGRADVETLGLAREHLPIVTAMVRRYVQGTGFDPLTGEPDDDLAAVIVSSTARLVPNPQQDKQHTVGPFSVTPGMFSGWTLPELSILNAYRKRAA